ncbi:MAG: 4-alpha-glucanotransferase [Rubrobacteraceae bacterium]
MTRDNKKERAAGILLHPTSLPGWFGAGDLGCEAFEFVRFLEKAGQRIWQVLPLGPTGGGDSPYSAVSAFAGNPLLVSTERLVEEGLLDPDLPESQPGLVEYATATAVKMGQLREAYGRAEPGEGFDDFRERHGYWLDDYALYAALKTKMDGVPWNRWETGLREREPEALARARRGLAEEIRFHEYFQYLFFQDWERVRKEAGARGVEVVGDLPIFVSHDSADVWANQRLFHLDGRGEPTVVAGVPPDYFSETGQLWGNPLYDWGRMREEGYRWWVERIRMALTLYDTVRIDHFRGFEAYWEVPTGEKTAAGGRWVKGPGREVFDALAARLGELPIIAEDLGEITAEVEELRDTLSLPGMKVLQFAFSSPDNPHLPHNYEGGNWVVYTGTHDNDTTAGWWASAAPEERSFTRRYLGKEYVIVWDLVRLAYSSTAARAIVPMQDLLGLGTETRMNTPGTVSGNWTWRLDGAALTDELAVRLRNLVETYGR